MRERFPSIKLMADANSAYTLADADHLRRLDDFYLMMIEQPLATTTSSITPSCRRSLQTPICLDECIRTAHHAEQAIQLHACGIINIKLGRVGGFREAKRVHDVAQAAGIPVWCGGMLEAGIGRAHNIALATLPNFVLPGDVSASKRYWKRDIIQPAVETTPRGTIAIRDEPGFGYRARSRFHPRHHGAGGADRLNAFVSLLRENRNYRNTWIGQVVSEVGDHFNNIAVFSLAVMATKSPMVVSGVMLSRAIPAMLAGPLAGVVLDRFDRKRVMICERPHPRGGGGVFHPHRAPSRHLAALSAERAADVRLAVLHQRPRGDSALHRHQRRTAHRQLADPDHRMDHARGRRVPRRDERDAASAINGPSPPMRSRFWSRRSASRNCTSPADSARGARR